MKKLKGLKKRYIFIALAILSIIILLILGLTGTFTKISNIINPKAEELKEISWETKSISGDISKVLIKFYNENGIVSITYPTSNEDEEAKIVKANGKKQIGIDYEMEDRKSYTFTLEFKDGESKAYTIDYEIPRIKGNYILADGIYVNEPDLTEGFVESRTRYVYLNNKGHLTPGNWISDEAPQNWYSYRQQKWANIYVEDYGVDSYYVWIPRYAYKLDSNNQRSDVKFINTYNEYIDAQTGQITEWAELEAQGYQIPEAFLYGNYIIPGYWMSKYQLSDLGSSFIIDYYLSATDENLNVNNISTNTNKTIAKYTYAINGKIVYQSTSAANYSFQNVGTDAKVINVTCLDSNGSIIGSMTKELEITEVNKPDTSKFDQDTTFYVYWDSNGNEHNEVPISKDPPEEWYNYSYAKWANVVTRNNGVETYLVWIPRYEYKLNTTSQRSDVKFILGTGTDTTEGYQIPEAFTFGGQELTGYWMSKYQLSIEESNPRLKVDIASGNTYIKVKDIQGTLIDNANTSNTKLKIEYYLNGELKHTGNSTTENYQYTDLNVDTQYTINIILRNNITNEYIGAITKKITTEAPNEPDISAFDKNTTFYVIYNDDGTEKERIPLTESAPSNWYDYSNNRWANIVTTANNTETYFVWIPRYEYRLDTASQRSSVKFIKGTGTNTSEGYQIPEAFTFAGQELKGFWMSKYQLNN